MAVSKKDRIRAKRRTMRVRRKLKDTAKVPRVSVFRSLNHIYAQIIDDNTHKTLASFSSQKLNSKQADKKKRAHEVGIELAKQAKDKGIESVVFDRGKYLFHGRVGSLAQGLREGGLKF